MNRNEFSRLLKSGQLPSVLLFEGEEDHLKQTALRDLRKALLPEGLEELNETSLDHPDTDAVLAAAETLPFLADRRLVILRDDPALVGRAEADERLLEYLPHMPPTTILLFYCVQKTDKRKKLHKAVEKLNGVVSFDPLKDQELTHFVTDAFHQLGRECDQRTADFLIFTVGSDANRLLSEVAKIASYHPENPSINPDDVKALATPSTESSVFQMVEAVVAGQNDRAFALMRKVLLNGEDEVFLLAMLLRQFRLLQHVKIMQYEKQDRSFIRTALGVPPFAVDQYVRQASAWSGRQVKDAVAICLDAEYAVKSGRLHKEGTLEAVMLKLLLLQKK